MEKKNGLKAMISDLVTSLRFGDGPLWKERISYFFTNIGNIPIMTMVNAYLLYYYTDTLGMDPNTVATMALVSRVFDGVNDPFIGYFIDRSPNSRFGKFRRTLIIGVIICTLNYAVVWMGPAYVSETAKYVIAYISYMLLGVTFPVMDIALNSMLPVMTTDMDERNVLATIKNLCIRHRRRIHALFAFMDGAPRFVIFKIRACLVGRCHSRCRNNYRRDNLLCTLQN